ncbi:phage resistance protein [Candidatus Laterigemmans baculatus]|uniref:phage resistance protein n=1 Tax=Candidatus Laterigemmans baculatus TaxID=2770505 RepID=UPI0013DB248F|nr:phage resistance protein [Candidatus Laterigemmans baculatus]
MTLLKDLIDIPEHIQRGDFVLRLSEGVTRADQTVKNYVATPELVKCFDDALSFVRSALVSNTSKASYLHGSFGSGKSHFMAVLHLILQGNTAARSITELAGVIDKHNEWTQGEHKKFLMVPYHMLGSTTMESGILGGYVDFIRRTHPNAPIPAVYLSEGLFRDAHSLRQQIGDAAFFTGLNEGEGGGDGGWGEFEAEWDARRFDEAIAAPPGDDERLQLISRLLSTYFKQYHAVSSGSGEAYVSLDHGLSVISKHAASLGYDCLILFLDELILWLASRAADVKFVHQEVQKLAKLVEAQTADRPTPIVSFVARQRDLRELVGNKIPGMEKHNFADALGYQEGRFHTITLEDRNLPAIAERRVLCPRDNAARNEISAAFERVTKVRDSVLTTLLTSEGDRQMFRQVYPFSPALVQTLIALSSMLQRERTALKAMAQLLVEQRETLQLGDIVPVGDLFDVIAHGDEAFSPEMASHFENARRLYHQKLLPQLERTHGRVEELEKLPFDDPKRVAFRNDDRLIKTLLLSALAPDVEALRGLNAERLAALNHGTIKTPIPGREGAEVLRRCKQWAADVGEIRLGEEANPTITVQLSGVDTGSIIEQAGRENNIGNRIRRTRQMIFEQLGIADSDEFFLHHEFTWRHTRRTCEVLFRNMRELPLSSLEAEDEWKLVIDFPFDESGHGPRDDVSKVQEFLDAHPEGTKTLVWIPAFLSTDAERDLGMLVILEHILTGERFGGYASHLSPQDRQTAKSLLDNQRSVLRQRVQSHLEAAYGLDQVLTGSLDTVHDLELSERFQSLLPGFKPQPPVAANLRGAMESLLDQALAHEFPAHPYFEADVKTTNLRKVYEVVSEATQSEDGRVLVDKPLRPLLRQIAGPLMLGEMGYDATHFVLGHHWRNHFMRKTAETGSEMSVEKLREWIDQPKPMGLPREAENLVILIFAEQTNQSFYLHGGIYDQAKLTDLPERAVLREEQLPDKPDWDAAVARSAKIFGMAPSPLLKAANVSALTSKIKEAAGTSRRACQMLCSRLRERLEWAGVNPDSADRLQTATATLTLADALGSAEAGSVVEILAKAEVATSLEAMGSCYGNASEQAERLDATDWEILDAIRKLQDERQQAAEKIIAEVAEALRSDEHVLALGPALKSAQSRAVRLLAKAPAGAAPPPTPPAGPGEPRTPRMLPPVPPQPAPPQPGRRVVEQDTRQDLGLSEANALLTELDQKATAGRTVRVSVSWRIEEEA